MEINIFSLRQAIDILSNGCDHETRMDRLVCNDCRRGIRDYLRKLHGVLLSIEDMVKVETK